MFKNITCSFVIFLQIMEGNNTQIKGKNSVSVKKMRDYYEMCMDVKTIEKRDIEPVNKVRGQSS